MLGFAALVIGRIVSGDIKRLNVGTGDYCNRTCCILCRRLGDLVTEIRKGKILPLNFNPQKCGEIYRTFFIRSTTLSSIRKYRDEVHSFKNSSEKINVKFTALFFIIA